MFVSVLLSLYFALTGVSPMDSVGGMPLGASATTSTTSVQAADSVGGMPLGSQQGGGGA